MRKIKVGDNVEVMRGKDVGRRGQILKVIDTKNKKGRNVRRVVVEGVNLVRKSQKPNPQFGIEGGIIEVEKPIDISNVMVIDPKEDKPTRVGVKVDEKTGKRVRYAKKSGEVLP